jgi:Mg2+/Co2+ transporter CorB
MIGDLLLIGILLLLLFFFSSAETSLTVVSKPLMHQLEVEGDRRAGRVNRLLEGRNRLLGSILLGNTLTQILASALATSLAIRLAGDVGVAYGTALMTIVVLLFCEILPKSIALNNANKLALLLAPLMRVMVWVLGPISAAIQAVVNVILRVFHIPVRAMADLEAARAELRGAIEIHTSEEEVHHERKMLRSILDLNDVLVAEVMTHRKNIVTLDAGLPVSALLDQVIASPFTRLPLWRNDPDNIVGVVHSKALLRILRDHDGKLDEAKIDALASAPWFIPDQTTLLDQLQAFRERREHFALVVDEYGALQGIVTLEDILEEIVGEISDETDVAVPGVKAQADGSLLVNGDVTLRDLNRDFDWRLPDENAVTLAGLILHESRMIPDAGQLFLFHGFRFEVLRRLRNQITLVKVIPPKTGDAEIKP